MSKSWCKTCKGLEGCIHLGIVFQAEQEEEILGKIESLRLKEKEHIEKKTEVKSNSKNGKKIELIKKKSRMRETKHLSTDADNSTDTTVGWTKNTQNFNEL